MIKFTLRRDTITPDLRARISGVSGRRKAALLRLISDSLTYTARGSFNDRSYRPTPWPNKKDGSVATLQLNQLLARSPRTVSATPRHAILGSDRHYAAVHQMGSKKKGIPDRRYMLFIGKKPTALASGARRPSASIC